jgi:hypothetical protein
LLRIFGAAVTGRPVVVSRLCFPRYSWLPDHLAREGVRYAYFVDDNFWEITADIDVRLARFFRHPAQSIRWTHSSGTPRLS